MRRWICMVPAALLLALVLAAPAGACACGGEPYSPWRDRMGVAAPIAAAAVTGWVSFRAVRRKASK